jgi:hypothetical protein
MLINVTAEGAQNCNLCNQKLKVNETVSLIETGITVAGDGELSIDTIHIITQTVHSDCLAAALTKPMLEDS